MDQRVALVGDWLRQEWTITELGVRYGVSRKTVYKWLDRYAADAWDGLGERSRAPHRRRVRCSTMWVAPASARGSWAEPEASQTPAVTVLRPGVGWTRRAGESRLRLRMSSRGV